MNDFNGYSEAYAIGAAMAADGDSGFYALLGQALQKADKANALRIKQAWPSMWQFHKNRAKRMPQFQSRK